MCEDNKSILIVATAIVTVLCSIIFTMYSYNVRSNDNELALRKAAFAMGLCEVPNNGNGWTHYEKCK